MINKWQTNTCPPCLQRNLAVQHQRSRYVNALYLPDHYMPPSTPSGAFRPGCAQVHVKNLTPPYPARSVTIKHVSMCKCASSSAQVWVKLEHPTRPDMIKWQKARESHVLPQKDNSAGTQTATVVTSCNTCERTWKHNSWHVSLQQPTAT